jgi:hypothetical protein
MNRWSRRNFLKIGGASLAIPFLESIPVSAQAATASGSLKRILFYSLTNSWFPDQIFPQSPTYLTGPEGVRYMPLNSISGDISPVFTATKFGALKSKMNLIRGLDVLTSAEFSGGGHSMTMALGSTYAEKSSTATKGTIDALIAGSSVFYPNAPFRRMMNALGASGNAGHYDHSSYGSVLQGPSQIFKDFFSGVTLPSSGGGSTPSAPADTNLSRRLAMNAVMSKFTALSNNTRLSSVDKQKLAEHAEMINKLMPVLAAPTASGGGGTLGGGCVTPTAVTGLNETIDSASNNGARLRACMDLIYMAFNCQLTNIVTFHPVCASDDSRRPMADDISGDIYHSEVGHIHKVPEYLKYKGFLFDHLVYLLNKMDATKESNGLSMLDNSLVVIVSNDGCSTHSDQDMAAVTFGGLGGLIKTGNYINYARPDAPTINFSFDGTAGQPGYRYTGNYGRPYNSLFTTLLNVLKIPHSGFGEYASTNSTYAPFITAAGKQANLPILV